MARRLPDCKNISPLFSDSFERRLSLREKIQMRLHLFTCGACLNYISNLKFMSEVFNVQERKTDQEEYPVSLSSEARERLKSALKSTQS